MAGDVYVRLGAAIRSRRGAAGMTQAQLADRAGLARSSVTNMESGGQAVLLHQLLDVADALGSDACDLIVEMRTPPDTAPPSATTTAGAAELLSRIGATGASRRR